MRVFLLSVLLMLFSFQIFGAVASKGITQNEDRILKDQLLNSFRQNYTKKDEVMKLKQQVLKHSNKAVPALIEIMKNSAYPEKSRWMATFLIGRIMGPQAAPFLAKFIEHPEWLMRMASLKVLMLLKQDKMHKAYALGLQDESLLVRTQALECVRNLKIKELAPQVWAMMYDKKNYYQASEKKSKRAHIIRSVIRTIGELEFKDAQAPLLSMMQKDRYQDVFEEIDYSLGKITKKASPGKNIKEKRLYWSRVSLGNKII